MIVAKLDDLSLISRTLLKREGKNLLLQVAPDLPMHAETQALPTSLIHTPLYIHTHNN